ncbi:SDR family NAD(P)-dependent oxidoreductase [Sphingopyxis sp.]|jgi:3-oxoacyl-[acyl-carrier protein] reductase|uniref:SDR family NAD(P)-dependent oxidoreductase n=1 Tax=Sphingopyxis sp. TaxID=1908224 RepID=UPI002DF6DE85|nr:SDR family NAD(P)-dependent oxidoreductase [Sphingopyxis sp.]
MTIFADRFAGRTAVVTGGASGLGLDVARRIVAEGGRAILWDHDTDALARAHADIGALAAVRVDIASWEAVEAAAAESLAAAPAIDILVNSAGITGPTTPVTEFPLEGWHKVIDINLSGTFYACRALAASMTDRGYGRIINIASVAGKEGNPNAAAYSASKAGVLAFTKSLGKELATKGVLVNAVTPAVFDSPLLGQMPQSQIDFMRSKIPMGRLGRTEETTAMVCFLASEECSFSTAATFDTSGGRTTY